MSAWQKYHKKNFEAEKYVKQGAVCTINIEVAPKEVERKGRFGDRTLYLVQDVNLGMVLISPKQMLKLGAAIGDLTKGTIVIEL